MAPINRRTSAEYEAPARRKLGTGSLGLTFGNADKYTPTSAPNGGRGSYGDGMYPGMSVAAGVVGRGAASLFGGVPDRERAAASEQAVARERAGRTPQPNAAARQPSTPVQTAPEVMGPPEPLAGQQERIRDRLIQQELISRKQLGTIGKPEADAIAANLRMNRREYDLADSSRRQPPPISTASEYAEKARRSDQSLLEQTTAMVKPLEDRIKAGESLSPEEASDLERYRNLADRYRSTLESETTTEIPGGRKVSWSPNDAYYAERGEAGLRSAQMRDAAFMDTRAAERQVASEMYRKREQSSADAAALERARAETSLAEENARRRSFDAIPQTQAGGRADDAKARLMESEADVNEAKARQIIDSLTKADPIADAQERLAQREAAAVESGWTPDRANALADTLGRLGGFTSSLMPGVVNGSFWTGDISEGIQSIKEAEIDLAALEQQAASGDTSAQQEAARLLTQAMPPAPTGEYTGGFNPITVGVNPSTATSQRAAGEVLARKMNELRGRLASIAGKYAPR